MAVEGLDLTQTMFESVSGWTATGLSVGVTAPDAPRAVLWTETAGMFLGRLEFFVVLVSLAKLVRDLPGLAGPRRAR